MLASGPARTPGTPRPRIGLLGRARRVAPRRADVLLRTGDIAQVDRRRRRRDRHVSGRRSARRGLRRGALPAGASCFNRKGRDREAERELVAALDAVPTYAEATLALAELRRRFGRSADAMPLLIELLQRDPYNLDALSPSAKR